MRAIVLSVLVLAACDATPARDGERAAPEGEAGGPAQGGAGGESGLGGTMGSAGAEPIEPARLPPGAWIALDPGTFVMGAEAAESCFTSDNQRVHTVTLTHAFEIGATEVTQADALEVLGHNDAYFSACGGDCPLDTVDWHEAARVCNAMSDYAEVPRCYVCTDSACEPLGGAYACAGYRLPTEAEWEYAYRAGTTTAVYNGDLEQCGSLDDGLAEVAWFLYNGAQTTHPVMTKAPNAWGLYDMAGNVWEWTHDGYAQYLDDAVDPLIDSGDDLRVMRGGSFNCLPGEVRAAHRSGLPDVISGTNVGVRCARTLF
jgi:formylglycine-generating enzyme required for sulfatase activity